jgi:hypothetical protein
MSRSGSASWTSATWRHSIRTACLRLTRCSGPRSALRTRTTLTGITSFVRPAAVDVERLTGFEPATFTVAG